MIQISLIIPEANVKLELFFVDAPLYLNREIGQAIQGEINFNKMEYGFGGLVKG